MINKSLAEYFPELINSWHPNKNGNLSPHKIAPKSNKRVWWICDKGHEWQTGVVYRTRQKSECPYCSGRYVCNDNCLKTLYPELAKEWHPSKNGKLTSMDVTAGTDRKVWWKCKKGHSWKAGVCHRTGKKPTGCPYCSGRYATVDNNLSINYPELLKEWHYEKNNPLKPSELKSGSNKKVWWKCERGHEWETSPNKRTGADKTGCPYCNPQTSRFEIRILCELKYLLDNVKWREKIDGIEADIFIPKYSLAIEVDGYRWHVGKEDRDKVKGQELRQKGIKILRLRDDKLNIIDDTDTFCNDNENDITIVHRLLNSIKKHVSLNVDDSHKIRNYLKSSQLKNKKEYNRLLSYLPFPPPERSLAILYKNLVPEWHYEKNAPMIPENFTPSARAKVWWKCPNGHEYKSFLYNRIKGVGCPYCAGRKVSADNNLAYKAPHLLKEWHFYKNESKSPDRIYFRSTKKVWWKCQKGHEWQATPQKRVLGTNCPYCSGKKKL